MRRSRSAASCSDHQLILRQIEVRAGAASGAITGGRVTHHLPDNLRAGNHCRIHLGIAPIRERPGADVGRPFTQREAGTIENETIAGEGQ